MNTALSSILKTVDNIKSAWELGNSEMVAADVAKLTAQLTAGIVVENALRTYSALDGLGKTMSLWRLDKAISGKSILNHQALSGFLASELVGNFIDKVRNLNLGGDLYDLLHSDILSPDLLLRPDGLITVIKYVDPLVLDLNGDGLSISPLSSNIFFDADGDTTFDRQNTELLIRVAILNKFTKLGNPVTIRT